MPLERPTARGSARRAPAPAWASSLAAVAVLGAVPAPARTTPLRVVVRVASETDAALLDRVRGQTADLDVELTEAPAEALEPSLALQVAAAVTLAETRATPVVVWFSPGPGGAAADAMLVHVAEAAAGRILVRAVGSEAPAGGPSSATLEGAALVVRTALRALAAGGAVGVEAFPPAPAPSRPEPAPPMPPAPPAASVAPPSSLGWLVELAWNVALDGSPHGQHGVEARVGMASRVFEVTIAGVVGVPSDLTDAWTTVHLSRHVLALASAVRVDVAAPFDILLGAWLGAAAFHRTTSAEVEWVAATPSRTTWSFLLGVEAGLCWAPPALGGFGFTLTVGGDWVPRAPALTYSIDGRSEPAHDLWTFQPRVGLGLRFAGP